MQLTSLLEVIKWLNKMINDAKMNLSIMFTESQALVEFSSVMFHYSVPFQDAKIRLLCTLLSNVMSIHLITTTKRSIFPTPPLDHYLGEVGWLMCFVNLEDYAGWSIPGSWKNRNQTKSDYWLLYAVRQWPWA